MNPIVKKIYVSDNDIWGHPQKYKEIEFYPLKISEAEYLELLYNVFAYPKNYIPDKQILKMSYLKFILYPIQISINPEGNEIEINLIKFLKFVTKKENIDISWSVLNEDKISLDNIIIKINIDGREFYEDDFDNIREIILEQNGVGIDYVEQYNPELEKKLLLMKKNEQTTNFSDEVFIFCSLMRKTINEIKDYTLFQFKSQFEHLMILKDYELYKPLEASGQISFKNGGEIKHYLTGSKKSNRYDSILIRKDNYLNSSDIFKL